MPLVRDGFREGAQSPLPDRGSRGAKAPCQIAAAFLQEVPPASFWAPKTYLAPPTWLKFIHRREVGSRGKICPHTIVCLPPARRVHHDPPLRRLHLLVRSLLALMGQGSGPMIASTPAGVVLFQKCDWQRYQMSIPKAGPGGPVPPRRSVCRSAICRARHH